MCRNSVSLTWSSEKTTIPLCVLGKLPNFICHSFGSEDVDLFLDSQPWPWANVGYIWYCFCASTTCCFQSVPLCSIFWDLMLPGFFFCCCCSGLGFLVAVFIFQILMWFHMKFRLLFIFVKNVISINTYWYCIELIRY